MSVGISYNGHTEVADLAGVSLAEAHEMYTPVFDIPDKAQATLNGKELKKKLEPETRLGLGQWR